MVFFFFFKQKTAYEMRISDWSSDVCSSDLLFELEQITPNVALASRHLRHRQLQPLLLRTSLRNLIPCIRMPHHAGARVVPQHAGDAPVGGFGAVADDDDAAVLGVANPYPAAVVQADPGGAAGDVEHGVAPGPVAGGIGDVARGLGFAVGVGEPAA